MALERKVTVLPESAAGGKLPLLVDPVTAAIQVGDLVNTTGILGVNPKTGALGDGPEQQFDFAFRNLAALMEKAGLSTDEVGLVSVFIPNADGRQYINKPWLEVFPDENNRPARKTNYVNLPAGVSVQLQAAGVAGGQRQRIELPGLAHRDPLPNGCRIGNMVYSSVLVPQDPATSQNVEGILPQIQRCYDNTKLLMEKAGGSLDDVVHMWVYMNDFTYQPDMVRMWVNTWPKEGDRPARKTLRYPTPIQMQATGVLGAKRTNYEVPGIGHHDPIPMGAKVGNVFYSSGISGIEPGAPSERRVGAIEGLEPQIEQCQANMTALLEQAGGGLDSAALVTVLISEPETIPVVERHFDKLFPDPTNRPGLRFIDWNIEGAANSVQYHVTAVI